MHTHIFHCANCDWRGTASALAPIDDIGERVQEGELHPSGQCPKCDCLIEVPDTAVPDYTVRDCVRIHAQRLLDKSPEAASPDKARVDVLALVSQAHEYLLRFGQCEELPNGSDYRRTERLLAAACACLARQMEAIT